MVASMAIVNGAAVNIGVHVSLSILVSSVCMPSSGIPGSYGSSLSSFLKNLHTVFLEHFRTCSGISFNPPTSRLRSYQAVLDC